MTARPTSNTWIAFHKPQTQARLRLFCLPYAGGGASIYRTWQNDLPAEVEVCPVQLPGREGRLREKPYRDLAPLVDALEEALAPYLDRPYALFGYSMGSIVAYELARRLAKTHQEPETLLLAARRGPGTPREEPMHDLPKESFHARIRKLDGTPTEVLEHPELMELVEPLLRADFALNETYEPLSDNILSCPVTVLGGLKDGEVDREHLDSWQSISTGPFRIRMFPGGHFFIQEDRQSLLAAVAQELAPFTR